MRCFAGCATPRGFVSGFEGIYAGRARAYFIKGAPGVGKSSLMRRVAARQEAQGHKIDWFFCSADPDSLDGFTDETIGAAMLDATAPHACDPPLPGARDTLVSLGDFLNEAGLAAHAGALMALKAEIARETACAYRYLSAAAQAFLAGTARESGESRAFGEIAREINGALPVYADCPGVSRAYFLNAYTCAGEADFLADFPPESTLCVPAPPCEAANALLREVGREALARGLDATYFLHPLFPDWAAHLYLPQIPLLISTRERTGALKTYEAPFARPAPRAEAQSETDGLAARACEALARAKALHDEIEGIYRPHMDFLRINDVETRVTRALRALAGA